MKTISMSMGEIIAILDQINPEAYDKLQNAIESKVIEQIGENSWLKIWNSDEWRITLKLDFLEGIA
jgi:hypothetical protein